MAFADMEVEFAYPTQKLLLFRTPVASAAVARNET